MTRKKPITSTAPPASDPIKWPLLSSGVDTSYLTHENLDAQKEWEAHIAAG